jgi:hypothetical protein
MRSLHPALFARNPPIESQRIPYGATDGSGLLDDSSAMIFDVAGGSFIIAPGILASNPSNGFRISNVFYLGGVAGVRGQLNPDGTSPDFQFYPSLRSTGQRLINEISGTVQTAAGATSTLLTTASALPDNAITNVIAYVVGGKSDEAEGCSYLLTACYRRTGGGAPILCGAVTPIWTLETDATANATLAISGNNIIVQVTSPAGDVYDWFGSIDYMKRI